ncbi:MAG: hypothetical protein HOQ24_13265 [Mycobacteriaceae bacterium]|nr:hypothetical protein [Mycobacteriaceae bacterium]
MRYPYIREPRALPLPTTLLLHNDGSTTKLLQTLVGGPIRVSERRHRIVATDQLPRDLRTFEFLADTTDVVVRRTSLSGPGGVVVSDNLITCRVVDARLFPPGDLPFGLHTRSLGLYERRRLHRAGVVRSDRFSGTPQLAACRCYSIDFSDGHTVLVHETFNPAAVPVSLPTAQNEHGDPGRTEYGGEDDRADSRQDGVHTTMVGAAAPVAARLGAAILNGRPGGS